MAGSDACALHNPFIAGINHFFKVVVGQNLAGKIAAYTQNTNLFYSFSHVFILVSLFFFVFDDNFSNMFYHVPLGKVNGYPYRTGNGFCLAVAVADDKRRLNA